VTYKKAILRMNFNVNRKLHRHDCMHTHTLFDLFVELIKTLSYLLIEGVYQSESGH
jgi:hypothetical protein